MQSNDQSAQQGGLNFVFESGSPGRDNQKYVRSHAARVGWSQRSRNKVGKKEDAPTSSRTANKRRRSKEQPVTDQPPPPPPPPLPQIPDAEASTLVRPEAQHVVHGYAGPYVVLDPRTSLMSHYPQSSQQPTYQTPVNDHNYHGSEAAHDRAAASYASPSHVYGRPPTQVNVHETGWPVNTYYREIPHPGYSESLGSSISHHSPQPAQMQSHVREPSHARYQLRELSQTQCPPQRSPHPQNQSRELSQAQRQSQQQPSQTQHRSRQSPQTQPRTRQSPPTQPWTRQPPAHQAFTMRFGLVTDPTGQELLPAPAKLLAEHYLQTPVPSPSSECQEFSSSRSWQPQSSFDDYGNHQPENLSRAQKHARLGSEERDQNQGTTESAEPSLRSPPLSRPGSPRYLEVVMNASVPFCPSVDSGADSFNVFPVRWESYYGRLLENYRANMLVQLEEITTGWTLQDRLVFNQMPLDLAMSEPALFYALLAAAAIMMPPGLIPARIPRSLQARTVSALNGAFDDPGRATSDAVILAVNLIALFESTGGNARTASAIQQPALRRMVDLRGGLEALLRGGHDRGARNLVRFLAWTDRVIWCQVGNPLIFGEFREDATITGTNWDDIWERMSRRVEEQKGGVEAIVEEEEVCEDC